MIVRMPSWMVVRTYREGQLSLYNLASVHTILRVIFVGASSLYGSYCGPSAPSSLPDPGAS